MSAMSVHELQAEMSPRISGADLLELIDPNKFPRPKAQVLDVRSADLFLQGCIPGSINLPYQRIDWTVADAHLPTCPETTQLMQHRGKVIVVAGQADNTYAADVARILVRQGIDRVCSLNGGVEILKNVEALVAPTNV